MPTKTKTKLETWLYDNVFNNDKISFRHDLWSIYCRSKRRVAIINRKPSYKIGYSHLLKHIKELEKCLDQKDDLIEDIIDYYIDSKVPENSSNPELDERTATRQVYKLIYDDKWKNHIDGKFLTKEESADWFDDNHDAWLCSGDHIANMNYLDLAQWEVAEYANQNKLNN